MQLKVKLTLDDYRKWNFEFFYGGARRVIMILSSLVFFGFLTFFAYVAARDGRPFSTSLISVGLVVVFLLIFFPVNLYFRTKTYFESDKLLQEEQTYEIDEKGMKASSSNGNSDIPWDKIYGANLYKKYITILLSKNKAYLLPVRFFKDKSEMQELADLLKRVLPKGRVKGKITQGTVATVPCKG